MNESQRQRSRIRTGLRDGSQRYDFEFQLNAGFLKMNSINAERMKFTTPTESSCPRKSCKFSLDHESSLSLDLRVFTGNVFKPRLPQPPVPAVWVGREPSHRSRKRSSPPPLGADVPRSRGIPRKTGMRRSASERQWLRRTTGTTQRSLIRRTSLDSPWVGRKCG